MRTTSRGLPPAPAALSRAKTKRGSRPGIAQRGVASGRAHSASMESECALDSCVRAYPFRETTQIGCFRFAYINAPISGKPDTRKSDVSDLRTLNGPISGKPDIGVHFSGTSAGASFNRGEFTGVGHSEKTADCSAW